MQLLFAVRLGRLVWQHEYECSLKLTQKKAPSPSASTPPPKPKHSRHYRGEYPTGFQPKQPTPEEGAAPAEREDPE